MKDRGKSIFGWAVASLAMWLPVIWVASALASGSCVFTLTGALESFSELAWVCTSAANGTVSTPTITGSQANDKFSGRMDRVQIIPGSGNDTPTNAYVVQLHASGDTTVDRLYSMGAACSNVTSIIDGPLTTTNGYPVRLFRDTLKPYATGAGDANKFTLKVLLDNRK